MKSAFHRGELSSQSSQARRTALFGTSYAVATAYGIRRPPQPQSHSRFLLARGSESGIHGWTICHASHRRVKCESGAFERGLRCDWQMHQARPTSPSPDPAQYSQPSKHVLAPSQPGCRGGFGYTALLSAAARLPNAISPPTPNPDGSLIPRCDARRCKTGRLRARDTGRVLLHVFSALGDCRVAGYARGPHLSSWRVSCQPIPVACSTNSDCACMSCVPPHLASLSQIQAIPRSRTPPVSHAAASSAAATAAGAACGPNELFGRAPACLAHANADADEPRAADSARAGAL